MNKIIRIIVLATFSSLIFNAQANAVDPSDFDPGRIIDDAVFTDTSTMSVSEIQAFLDAKMPNCDTNGTGTSPWYAPDYDGDGRQERWEYGRYKGNPAPFTCLKDYVENPTTQQNNYGGGSVSGGKSAARIIWEAAQAHDINPQVLIVTLQKESSLITDAWPFERQFDRAMGYACPDSGPNNSANCDESHYGFANQIEKAAWQFRRYLTYPGNYNYSVGNRYIQYNPSSSCGGSTVNIQTAATGALYNYTPYQPNQAALNNYPGTAPCGAYGNRNFWFTFNEWFSNTRAKAYTATINGRCCNISIVQGQTAELSLVYKNSGTKDWKDEQYDNSPSGSVMLGTAKPLLRSSIFGSEWTGNSKASRTFTSVLDENDEVLPATTHTVSPGQSALFRFTVVAPQNLNPGRYVECFTPFLFGSTSAFEEPANSCFAITVEEKILSAELTEKSNHYRLLPGEEYDGSFTFKNTGNTPWYSGASLSSAPAGTLPVMLATERPLYRQSLFGGNWGGGHSHIANYSFNEVYRTNGSLSSNQTIVYPGQSVKIDVNFLAPPDLEPGRYGEYFRLVERGKVNGRWTTRTIEHGNTFLNMYVD